MEPLILLLQATLSLAATSACLQVLNPRCFLSLTRHAGILPSYEVIIRSLAGRLAATRVTCFQRISGFCSLVFSTRLGDWPYAQPTLWRVGFFFRGFLPLGLKSEFSILLDELPTKATSLFNPGQIGFKAPTTRHCTTRISDKTTPRRERASG